MGIGSSFQNAAVGIVDFFKSLGTNDFGKAFDAASAGNIEKVVIANNKPAERKPPTPLSKELNVNGEKEVKALIRQVSFSLNQRSELINTLYKLRANDIVETIIDVMIDDGLVSGVNSKIFEKMEYNGDLEQEKVKAHIDIFKKRVKPDRTVLDFIDEALLLGEYILPIQMEEGRGIVNVLDNADMQNMVCIYEGTEKAYFLKKNGTELEKLEKDTHIHFVVNQKKLRVQVKELQGLNNKTQYILPQYLRVGKSIIFPVINKLKQLQTLEMANLANDLRDILKPTIIQVAIPEKTTPEKLSEIIERYEMIFSNIFASLQDVEELNFSDLLSVITTIKVVPGGSDGRGSFVKPDINPNSSSAEKEQMIRRSIALTVGIPFYYLSVNDSPTQRLESLKLFSRYARKLNSMQDCIIEGVKEMIYLHVLSATGIKIDVEDLEITMREIVNIELLDRMEYLVALMTGLEELIKLVSIIEESQYINVGINSDVLMEILNKNLGNFQGYDNLFIAKNKSDRVQQDQGAGSNQNYNKGAYENVISKFNKTVDQNRKAN